MIFKKSMTLENQILQYMNEKYTDDTFVYEGPTGGGAGADMKSIIVSSRKYPGKKIYAHYMADRTPAYTDNYLSVAYEQETKARIAEVLDRALACEYLLIYDISRFACPNPDGMMDFEAYIGSSESCIGFTVVAKEKVTDQAAFETALKQAIIAAGICCDATIYFDAGTGAFDTLTAEGLSGYTFKHLYSCVFSFQMSSKDTFSSQNWGE